MNIDDKNINIPALTMRGLVIFPGMILHFDVGREKSITALKNASEKDRKIFLVAQKDPLTSEPDIDDVYPVGVVAEIKQIITIPDNTTRVLVEGLYRAKVNSFVRTEPFYELEVSKLPTRGLKSIKEAEKTAALRALIGAFKNYSMFMPKMPKGLYSSIVSEKDLEKLFDLIIFNVVLKVEDKQKLLEISTFYKRVTELIAILNAEAEILELEMDIHDQVRDRIEQNQRNYYIREQIRVLSRQIGEPESEMNEAFDYIEAIDKLDIPDESAEKLFKEAEKLTKMPPSSQEANVIRTYLDHVLEIPWNNYTRDRNDIARAEKQLNKDHHGLKKVKERILELIAVRSLAPDVSGQIICLVGPPGVGKTSIGKSIAKSLNRNYARISLGGVRDEADIRGHRKTYIGAMPGRIANALTLAKSMNPVILLDEIDKMGSDFRGDPSSAMLEALDSEQNTAFRDHYLEVPMDLSQVLFITTANSLDTIPAPLLDRMEVIQIGSYTREEKFHIAKKHLIPKQLKKHGEKASIVSFRNTAIYSIIDNYTREAGVRRMEREIAKVCRKAAKILVSGEAEKVSITSRNLHEFLGVKKYYPEVLAKTDEVGLVNGLAWTAVGGVIMPLEVLILEGSGKVLATGSLGKVMEESTKIAASLTRSLAEKYHIDKNFYKNKDIHIHAPEGAVPKDGPSAGITLTTALVSALAGIGVRRDVAMTGEITLRGKVLPIGGLKEKSMAAYKAGVKKVIIPKDNAPDIEEIDEIVRENVEFFPVEDINEVLNIALVPHKIPVETKKLNAIIDPNLGQVKAKQEIIKVD